MLLLLWIELTQFCNLNLLVLSLYPVMCTSALLEKVSSKHHKFQVLRLYTSFSIFTVVTAAPKALLVFCVLCKYGCGGHHCHRRWYLFHTLRLCSLLFLLQKKTPLSTQSARVSTLCLLLHCDCCESYRMDTRCCNSRRYFFPMPSVLNCSRGHSLCCVELVKCNYFR